MKQSELIKRCIRGERVAQKHLYETYAPRLMAICMRYMKREEVAEDMLIQTFVKIFLHLHKFTGKGSLEGWMKRIAINECLMDLRKKNNLHLSIPIEHASDRFTVEWSDNLTYEELLKLLDQLPVGYRTVFNLYVIEGYLHREIAEMLGISINTSKSQLILARKKLQELIKKNWIEKTA